MGNVRIVSLNAWGGAMFDELAQWVPGCGADVLCLQEVTRTPRLGGWTEFTDGERNLPQRANLFDDVRRLLPGHQAMFLASDAGPVTDRRGRSHRQDFGVAVFVDETISVVAHTSAFVHGSFADHVEWAVEDRPRVAQAVRLVDRAGSRTLTVVHLHGLRDPSGKADTPARKAQAERLAELVTATRDPADFVVVCGDLNLLPSSETFAVLGAIGMTDLVGERDTRTSRYTKPVRNANYLLVSEPDAVEALATPAAPEVSDHRPLILDI
ncbi:MAG: endonuclease/exonuclease/phosphatase family protein [Acidimicrobiales bacterium]